MNSQKILSDALSLSGRRLWTILLSVATSYATARFLGPTKFGLLAAFTLIPSLAVYGSVGWDQAATRELPHLKGRGDEGAARKVRSTAYVAELALALCWVGIAVVVAFCMPDWFTRIGMLIGAVSLLVNKLLRFFVIDTFVDKDFALQARVGVAVATVSAGLQIIAAWQFGTVATFGGILLANLCGLWFYKRVRPLDLTLQIDRAELWRLTKIGFPMAILSLLSGLNGLMVYIDRAILGSQAGLEVLGLYVFASSLSAYLVAFMGDFIWTYQPHLLEALARASGRDTVFRLMSKPSLAMAYISAIMASCMLAVLPLLITLTLPKYLPVIPLLPVFFTGGLIVCFYYLPATFLNSAFADQQWYYTKAWAVAVALFTGALWLFVHLGWGLAGGAWATLVPPLCVAALTIRKAYPYYISDWRLGVQHVLEQLLPSTYVVTVYAIASFLVYHLELRLTAYELLDRLIVAGLTLLVTCLPLLLMADRILNFRRLIRLQYQPSL